jgi:hypothetical protein
MMITLKHDAVCVECGGPIPAGSKARWYRNGDVYGSGCHRWEVILSPRQQKRLQAAAQAVLSAARGPRPIPEAVATRLAALKPDCHRKATKQNFEFLIAELRSIEEQLRDAN